jgi:hypothetical protein
MNECPICKSSEVVFMKQAELYSCQTCHQAFYQDGRVFVPASQPTFNKAADHSHEGVKRAMERHKISPAEAAMMQATIFELVSDGYKNGFREGLLLGTRQTMYNLTKEESRGD